MCDEKGFFYTDSRRGTLGAAWGLKARVRFFEPARSTSTCLVAGAAGAAGAVLASTTDGGSCSGDVGAECASGVPFSRGGGGGGGAGAGAGAANPEPEPVSAEVGAAMRSRKAPMRSAVGLVSPCNR